MQLPPDDEIVMIAGTPPIRAKKARYFTDQRFTDRLLSPPAAAAIVHPVQADDWIQQEIAPAQLLLPPPPSSETDGGNDGSEAGIRKEPEVDRDQDVAPPPPPAGVNEFDEELDDVDEGAARARLLKRDQMRLARRAALDPDDGMDL